MAKFTQIPTPDEIAAAKSALNDGKPYENPVWLQRFGDGNIQFLITWINDSVYAELQANYIKGAQRDPAGAERWLQIKLLENGVVWPTDFNAQLTEEYSPYPAGVIPGLASAILTRSGIGVPPMPDVLLVAPPVPEEPTDDEKAELEAGTTFGLFEKIFFVGTYNDKTDQYEPVPSGYFIYTLPSYDVYKAAQETTSEEEGVRNLVAACVVWPKVVEWSKQPAGYCEVLYTSIMSQLGLAGNSVENGEEV